MLSLHPRRLLRSAWHLVLTVVALVYLLVVRSALWVFTLLLMVYFSVGDPALSGHLLSLANEAIPGSIHAQRIHWEPFRGRIHVLGVVITRPGEIPVIQAERVSTDMRLGTLIATLVMGGGDDPIPLIFDKTLVRNGVVDLEFRDSGLLLVDAFTDPDEPPSDDPAEVLLQMRDIRIENTRVRLDFFGEWGLMVHQVDLDGEVDLKDDVVTVGARGITATQVGFLGSLGLPESLDFLFRPVTTFRTSRFLLHGDSFEIGDATGRAERFDFRLTGTMDFSPDRPLSLDAAAALRIPDPTVLVDLTEGTVSGQADAMILARGPLESARLDVSVSSPEVEVLGVPLDDVDAAVTLSLADPTLVRVRRVGCWYGAGRLDAEDLLVHALPGGADLVQIGGAACVEGLDVAAVTQAFGDFDLRSLSPLLDGRFSGCIGMRSLRVTDDDVFLDLSVEGVAGASPDPRTGLGAAWAVDGHLKMNLQGMETEGLSVLAGMDSLSLKGGARWDPELSFDLVVEADSPSVARHLRALGISDIDGDVVVHRLALRGGLDAPHVDLEATVEDLQTLWIDLAQVDLDAQLLDGDLTVRRLAWADPRTDGALAGDIERLVGPDLTILKSPWRVGIEALAPLRLPLNLVAPDEEILGEVRLDSLFVDGRIGTRAQHLLRDLRVAGEGEVMDLISPFADVRRAAVQFTAETGQDRGVGPPRIGASVQLQGEAIEVAGVTLDAVEASAALQGIPLRFELPALSMIHGDLTVEARGFARDFLAFKDLAISVHYPEGGDATIAGKVQVVRGVGARIEGVVARKDLRGHARLRFDKMPLRSIPMPISLRQDLGLIREALFTGQVRLDWPALEPLLALPARKLLPRLTMSGDLRAERLETLPEPVKEVSASLTLKGGRLNLKEVRLTLPSGFGFRGSAFLDLDRMTGEGRVTWSPLDLRSLEILRTLDLPLQARIGGRVDFEGELERPRINAALRINRLRAAGINFGDASLDISGRIGESLLVDSDDFFEGFTLHALRIDFDGLEPVKLDGLLGFEELRLARILPDEELPVAVKATGAAQVHINTRSRGEMLDATIHVEDQGLEVEIPALARLLMAKDDEETWETGEKAPAGKEVLFRMVNDGAVDFVVTERGGGAKCLRLSTPLGPLSVSGDVDLRRGYSLDVGGAVALDKLAFLAPWLARLRGEVLVGTRDACEAPGGWFKISGPLDAPEGAGRISLVGVDLLVRGYPHDLQIQSGGMELSGRLDSGDLRVRIPEASRIEAKHDEGRFTLWGDLDLKEWVPQQMELTAEGSNIYVSVPRQYRLTMNPNLHLSLLHPMDPERATGLLRGEVDVTEGKYYRNFDRLLGSFATAFSRSQERYSRPISEIFPFLKALRLEVDVRSADFTVASRFPFGETDMEVDVDLKARGTFDDLELHDRLTLIPGGMITYKVVKREFEVQSGFADFTGNPGKPTVDIQAVTTINRIPSEAGGYVSQSEKIWGRDVNITVHVYGTYPDLRFDLSSDSGEYDQSDLQTLLLLGMTRKDLESQGVGEGGTVSINLLTDDVASAVSNLLLSPFLDAVSLGFTREGGIQAETLTKVGRAMHLTTKVAQEADLQEYTAGFRFMLTDRLYLEGRMKMKQDSTETNQNYEGRLLYRIPLE